MSYQVFARKYRPQTFDEVIGQEHITQTLKNAIEQNRLAHAYLFVGPRGTGKTSTARILAKALNCEKGPTISPCGKCDVCKEISQGNSLDVLEIDGASNNGVEQVRELRENVRFAPTRGKYRIYIIDEVHMLSAAAFNALLKTLEEPPAHVKFVFATTEPQKVMATILSRCQRFDLRRIPAALIAEHLQFIAKKEKFALDDAAAKAIAIGAEGGLRDAESMLDQLVAFCGDKIAEQDVLSIFGFTSQQTVSSLCGHILGGASAEALGLIHEQAGAGKDLSRLMTDLIAHLRNLIVMKADPASVKAELGEKALASLRSQAEALSMERLLELIGQFADAEARMKWAPNKKLYFEIAVIKAVQTLGQATLTDVIDTLSAMRGGKATIAATPKPAARSESPPPAPAKKMEPAKPATGDADLWPGLLQRVRQERPLISAWIEAVNLLRLEGDACVLGFGKSQELAKDSLTRPNNQKFLEGILAELARRKIAIRWEKCDDLVADAPEAVEENAAASGDPMTAFKNDPLIKKALEIFKGEIQSA